jgi:hypothetical protein
MEWCIKATAEAVNAEVYEFRVTKAGVVLDTYTVTPQWTIGSAVADALGWMTDGQSNRPLPHHLDKGVYVGY